MIEIDVMHSFVLVGPRGQITLLASVQMDDQDLEDVLRKAATTAASPTTDEDAHAAVLTAGRRAFARLEEMPGTLAAAGERLGDGQLVRVIRHLAGEGPYEELR